MLGVGVVMPGPFGIEGMTSVGPTTLPGWAGVDAAAYLSVATGLSVVVENDATAASVGERLHGVGRTLRNFCLVYFGRGLGLGVIIDGRPYRGAFGNAGEIGHVVVAPGGRALRLRQSRLPGTLCLAAGPGGAADRGRRRGARRSAMSNALFGRRSSGRRRLDRRGGALSLADGGDAREPLRPRGDHLRRQPAGHADRRADRGDGAAAALGRGAATTARSAARDPRQHRDRSPPRSAPRRCRSSRP